MLLTKSRISVVAIAIISLILAFTIFQMAERASADNAAGGLPGVGFGDDTAVTDPGALVKWDWRAQGANVRIDLLLGAAWPNQVFGVEVFVDPAATNPPVFTQTLGNFGPFPTGQAICFIFTSTKQPTAGKVGIHLINRAKASLLVSAGPTLPGLTSGTPCLTEEPEETTTTPTPTPTPTRTPTPKLPGTGDVAPGSGMLLALLLAGFVMITAGGTYLVQSRRARD